MLAKNLRLNLARATWRFRKADFAVSTPYFKLLMKKTSGEQKRFGFLVSGKVGNAVKRNQIRRWLAACVASSIESFPKGSDFVFIAHPTNEILNHEKICSSINQVLPKIPLL